MPGLLGSILPAVDALYCSQQLLFPSIFPCGPFNLWSDGESLNDADDGNGAMEVAKHDFPGEVRTGLGDISAGRWGDIVPESDAGKAVLRKCFQGLHRESSSLALLTRLRVGPLMSWC